MKYHYRLLVFLLFGFISVIGQTETATASQTAERDPRALQLITTALNAMGGSLAWQSIHAARVQGTATYSVKTEMGYENTSHPIQWVDDWSTTKHRYIRSVSDSNGSHTHRSDGTNARTTTFKGQTFSVRSMDTASVLLTHLPAVPLAEELRDPTFSTQLLPAGLTSDIAHIRVVKASNGTAQEWSISRSTGQLLSVRFAVIDPIHPAHQPWETVTYTHFTARGSLFVPDTVNVLRPNSQLITLQFTSLDANPTIQDSDFMNGVTR